jgi:hypothetical protein
MVVYTLFYMTYLKLSYHCGIKMVATRPRNVKVFMALVYAENGSAMVLVVYVFLLNSSLAGISVGHVQK